MNIDEIKDFTDKNELQKLHTKQLLNLYKGYQTLPWCDCGCYRTEDYEKAIPIKAALKEVLNTRPHVRNKKEAYEYRKAKAQGRNL